MFMPLCRDSALNFFLLKCAARAAGVICLFVHYSQYMSMEVDKRHLVLFSRSSRQVKVGLAPHGCKSKACPEKHLSEGRCNNFLKITGKDF